MYSRPLQKAVYGLLRLFPGRAEVLIFHYGNLWRGGLPTAAATRGGVPERRREQH